MKKLKRKLKKQVDSLLLNLKAQAFYAKSVAKRAAMFALDSVLPAAGSTVKIAALGAFVVSCALLADKLHVKYLQDKVGRNTVFIRSMPDSKLQGSGTAFEMKTPSGAVVTVTNAHICALANSKGEIAVLEKKNSNRLITRKVIEISEQNDLCIVEGLPGYDGLTIGSKVEVGEPVFSFGYPLGEALHFSEGRVKDYGDVFIIEEGVTPAQCKGPRRHLERMTFLFFEFEVCVKSYEAIQTSMVIYPGNSGSPMVNLFGNVVGVVFASNGRTNWGSAVVLKDLEQLLSAY